MKASNTFDPNVAFLTGGRDLHYSSGLALAAAAAGVKVDLIGGDDFESVEWPAGIRLFNLRGDQRKNTGLLQKIRRVLSYYARLIAYATRSKARIFHVLWNNKFELFDRTVLMAFYKLLGKKIVFTAHNVNAGSRDGCDSFLNRVSLRIQYRLCDRIFVHTKKMEAELISDFGVPEQKIVLIPFGINNAVPRTGRTRQEARQRLDLGTDDKVLLFFGNIAPYKGLHNLVDAFDAVARQEPFARILIAGRPKPEDYWKRMLAEIETKSWRDRVTQKIEYIPDGDIELYFKAADVLVMPYVHIFQSGVLFLAWSFGLPVIATDVGSLKHHVIEGETGFICEPNNPPALAGCIRKYFQSDLYRNLEKRRLEIQHFVEERHSWNQVAKITITAYSQTMRDTRDPGLVPNTEQKHEAPSLNSYSSVQR